jgi:hypothetical protein
MSLVWDIVSRILKLPMKCCQLVLAIGKPKPRFPNVPERLTAVVRDHMLEFEKTGDRNFLYLEAAGYVILEYLQIRCFDANPHPFWKSSADNEGNIWYGFPLRVILIGETLFLLRNCSGFAEICSRLKERDLRASYYEMLAAKIFVRAGFDVVMRPEKSPGRIKKRGEEFDFTAIRGKVVIAVEVTALEEKDFYQKTAINALNDKRTQLPKDRPTVFFCVIPPHWEKLGFNLNEWTANIANEFFLRGSRRVNRLVFYLERHIDGPTLQCGGSFLTVSKAFDCPNPYFAYNFDHIFGAQDRGDVQLMQLRMEDAFENPETASVLAKELRTGEFYEWVDSFHDERS